MLMVLVLLAEAPMHPYEMQRLMVWRGKDQVVRVQRGSLYPAVERLARAGLIEPLETERAGRRPERTVYQLTDEGRDTAETWLTTMIRTVRNEYPEFPAALSFIPMLSTEEARDQLLARRIALGQQVAAMRALAVEVRENYQLPRLFAIEDEYRLAMLEAEHAWVSGVLDDMTSGELYWDRDTIVAWARSLQHRLGSFPGIPRAAFTEADLPP
jgi:DNA-binding PadR family transcriptional regulator